MNERVWLVAKREFLATLATRAFITLMLAPVIVVLAVPMVAAPVVMVAKTLRPEAPNLQRSTIRLELVDSEDLIGDRLSKRLGDHFEVQRVTGERPLAESPAEVRVVVDPAEVLIGRYRLEVERNPNSVAARTVSQEMRTTVTQLRLERAGLTADKVEASFEVERELVDYSLPSADVGSKQDIWEALKRIPTQNRDLMAPLGALFIMFSALSMAGQGLLTSTLEEKTTRVSEVLLGAVSPVELLTGKALGQLAVSLVISLVWGGPGLFLLWWFAVYAVGPFAAVYLLVFIAIASLSWAAVMGGIGSAMNDLTEAQGILAPLFMVMMLLFVPALLAVGKPESIFVLIFSLVPPTAAPVMAARVASSVPPPHWQVWMAVLTSGAFALLLLWAAGRLYRIGLLVRGAPPNVRTLLRWIRTG